jgi:5-methylcytosine-specific restriction protein A
MSKSNPNWTRDELILVLDLYFQLEHGQITSRNPKIIELSDLLNALPIHSKQRKDQKFRNPNGVAMKMSNFLRFDPTYEGRGLESGSKLDQVVWEEYESDQMLLAQVAQSIRDNYQNVSELPPISDEETFREGEILTRLHRYRERDPKATKNKKKKMLAETGKLACEVCGFDFYEVYGELGKGFAECHHKTPVHQLEANQRTRLQDLAIVCSNCHRMLHRRKVIMSIDELKEIRQKQEA